MRLFFAFTLPDSVERPLQLVQAHLPGSGARWTKTRHFHLTLKFLGEVDLVRQVQAQCACRDLIQKLSLSLDDLKFRLTRVGTFQKNEEPSVVWVGVGMSPALYQFQYELAAALEPLGFAIEKQKFRPHVTLARLRSLQHSQRGRVQQDLRSLGVQHVGFEVLTVDLYRAQIREGEMPVYEVLESYPLLTR